MVLVLSGQHDSELFDRYDELELSIADNCVTRSDLRNLKQELLDEIGDKIQATMMDAGKGNPIHDLDHDEYPNPDHDPYHDEYPENHDSWQEYSEDSERDPVPDSPKFALTG